MSFLFPHSCSFEVSFCRVSTSSSLWILFMALCQQCTPKVPHRGCHKCLICVSGKELVQAQCTLLWGIPDLSKNFKDFWSSTKTPLVLLFRNCWILFPNFPFMRIRFSLCSSSSRSPLSNALAKFKKIASIFEPSPMLAISGQDGGSAGWELTCRPPPFCFASIQPLNLNVFQVASLGFAQMFWSGGLSRTRFVVARFSFVLTSGIGMAFTFFKTSGYCPLSKLVLNIWFKIWQIVIISFCF